MADDAPAEQRPFLAAADALRDAAKWQLGAFAAIGVTFAAGLQLASIGSLSWDVPTRLITAVAGIVATVTAVIYAVWSASQVLTRHAVTIDDLCGPEHDPVGKEIEAGEVLAPFTDLPDLRRRMKDIEARGRNPATAATPEFRAEARQVGNVRLRVLGLAGFLRVEHQYREERRHLAVAAVVAAVGIACFAWGANPPKQDVPLTRQVLPPAPSNVSVLLTAPSAALQKQLGPRCDLTKPLAAVAVAVHGEVYQVATVATKTCAPSWLSVGPGKGHVPGTVTASASTTASQ